MQSQTLSEVNKKYGFIVHGTHRATVIYSILGEFVAWWCCDLLLLTIFNECSTAKIHFTLWQIDSWAIYLRIQAMISVAFRRLFWCRRLVRRSFNQMFQQMESMFYLLLGWTWVSLCVCVTYTFAVCAILRYGKLYSYRSNKQKYAQRVYMNPKWTKIENNNQSPPKTK